MKSEAEKWDKGCKNDNVRNHFIIPTLSKLLTESTAQRVLDVGSGTGYIARSIVPLVSHKMKWALLDVDQARVEFTKKHIPTDMEVEIFTGDFLGKLDLGEPYDFVLLLFTLLEVNLSRELFLKIKSHVNENGYVVIAMPDSLEDVLQAAINKPILLTHFLNGECVLEKTDKFTRTKYPFKAHRFEFIVQLMLFAGFSLVKMYSYKNSGKETYMIVFRKDDDLG